MLGTIPFGGIEFTGQSTAQALTSGTAAQLVWSNATNLPSVGGSGTGAGQTGDPAIQPNPSGNGVIINTPGIYKVTIDISGNASGTMNVLLQLRKNQATSFGSMGKALFVATNYTEQCMVKLIQVTQADIPATGGQKTFADPASGIAAGRPVGGFAGAGGAPRTGIFLDVMATSDASFNLTLLEGRFLVERIG